MDPYAPTGAGPPGGMHPQPTLVPPASPVDAPPAPTPNHTRWQRIQHNFIESRYITSLWLWIVQLLTRSAEMVLFGSVLYSGYSLLPGVPRPPMTVDAIFFIAQQAALDIGGLGLLRLVRRSRTQEERTPRFAWWTGAALVSLMIGNVVVASLERLFAFPGGLQMGLEALLLTARAILTVLYGHAISELHDFENAWITQREAEQLQHHLEQLEKALQKDLQEVRERLQEVQIQKAALQTEVKTLHDLLQKQRATLQGSSPLQGALQSAKDPLQEQRGTLQGSSPLQGALQSAKDPLQEQRGALQGSSPLQGALQSAKDPLQEQRATLQGSSPLQSSPSGNGKAAKRDALFQLIRDHPEMKLAELRALLASHGINLSESNISRLRKRLASTQPSVIDLAEHARLHSQMASAR